MCEIATVIRISYCYGCNYFTQQTLHPKTFPRNRCSKCGVTCVGVNELGQRTGGRGDVSIDVETAIKRYSQSELRTLYLNEGGWIPSVIVVSKELSIESKRRG